MGPLIGLVFDCRFNYSLKPGDEYVQYWTVNRGSDTMRYLYNAVNFLQNPHKIHPIARPLGRAVGYTEIVGSNCDYTRF